MPDRLDAIVANLPQGVLFVDADSGEAIVNSAAARWLGTTAGTLTPQTCATALESLISKLRDADAIRREVARINGDSAATVADWTWELADGSGTTLRITSVSLDDASRHGRLWTFDDVSLERTLLHELAQHRVTEVKLRQIQKLEIVGRLAAGVAHDFNNLLTIIAGSAEMLEDLPLEPQQRADVQNIGVATDRARRLTRQLLTFTRQQVELGEAFLLDERLREAEPLFHKVIAPHRTLDIVLQAGMAQVFADPNQIEHALLNLLTNARDATGEDATITVQTTIEELAGERVLGSTHLLRGSYVAIAVHDTGSGIDELTRTQIFEPFFTTKRAGHGTGLGLATTLSIAQQAGGGLRCVSTPGIGSTFTLLLPCTLVSKSGTVDFPLAAPAAAPVEAPAAVLVDGSVSASASPVVTAPRVCVLLVDDDPGPRNTLRRLLVHEGYSVAVAEGGAEALSLLETNLEPISMLVTDYIMPRMSGRQLLEQVRIRWPQLPALIISGYAPDRETATVLTTLHAGFLAKPFTGRQLAEAIRHQLAAAGPGAGTTTVPV